MPVALVPLALAPVVAFAVPLAVFEAGEAVFVDCAAAFVVAADSFALRQYLGRRCQYENGLFTCVLVVCPPHKEAFEIWE